MANSPPVVYSSIGSLTFLAWDVIVTFDDEVEFIWQQPWRSPTKWLFLFSRHSSIIAQIFFLLRSLGYFGLNIPPESCPLWFTLQSVVTQIIIASVETILAMRVYALHNRSPKIHRLLVGLSGIELVVVILTFAIFIPQFDWFPTCVPFPSYQSLTFLHIMTASNLFIQTSIIVLTLAKTFMGWRSRGRIPILAVLTRDGLWAFLLVSCAWLSILCISPSERELSPLRSLVGVQRRFLCRHWPCVSFVYLHVVPERPVLFGWSAGPELIQAGTKKASGG
ncbi:hypothetical protein JAAARDRAFT_36569 [Jaapia argillacea MUCL 33604]|uniref:DUF6533 domain-containing protein n=1 Tax=Jaapia argillacea MUCL 33604 TaxID=933084 RepID=A0A067PRG0_9AGAM|nr:hypothetical protein JAAARDRAFT_36569 [Jaapia argillacea MUCL 33604]